MITHSKHAPTDRANTEFAQQDFIWGLGALAQLHRIPFDPKLIASSYAPPLTLTSFITAARALGLKCESQSIAAADLASLSRGSLIVLNGESTEHPARIALLLNIEGDAISVIRAGEQAPTSIPLSEFAGTFAGLALQAAPAAKPATDADSNADTNPATAPFGFRWFIPELLKYKRLWRDVLIASLAIQLLALATPLITQVVIDKVIVHQTVNTLLVLMIALAASMLFSQGMTWVRQYLVIHTGNRVDAVLGMRVWEQLLALPVRYFEARPTGTLVARMHGVETIRAFVSGAAVTLLLDLPFLVIFLAVMFFYSWQLTLLAVGLLALIVGLSLAVVPAIRERLNQEFQYGARNQAFVTEYLAGMATVKSLTMEPSLKSRYGDYLATALSAGFRTKTLSNTYGTLANSLEQTLTLAILGVGAWLVMKNDGFTIGMLVAFQMFAGRLSQPVLRLVGLWQEFQQAHLAVRRLGDIMNAPAEPYALVPARAGVDTAEIKIERLAFRYAEHLPLLYENLNLTLAPGKCIALMGASGSGKSTLAKLLQGFYLPTAGRITLAGRDIRHLAANELRGYLGVVPQETVLFAGTVYENLVMANPHASFQYVVAAATMAGIHETIERLPEGYQTPIGERGTGLSGGQRQRIAIARALLKRPQILIFDEATSNLDVETAEAFAKTINQLKGKVTMLFIAHALPKGLQVDDIVRLGTSTADEPAQAVVMQRA